MTGGEIAKIGPRAGGLHASPAAFARYIVDRCDGLVPAPGEAVLSGPADAYALYAAEGTGAVLHLAVTPGAESRWQHITVEELASLLDWRRLDDFENRGVQRADSVLALDKTVNVAKELSILAARDPEFAAVLERAMIHACQVLVESITADAVTRVGSAGAQDVIPVEILEAPQHIEVWKSVRVGGDAKTPKSRSDLALSELVLGVLRSHQQEQTTAAGEHWKDHRLVFPSEIGTPQDRHSVLRMFRSALALVPRLDPQKGTPRDLRHSFVSILSQRGVPIGKISCLMGHFGIRFHRDRLPPRAQTCHPVSSETSWTTSSGTSRQPPTPTNDRPPKMPSQPQDPGTIDRLRSLKAKKMTWSERIGPGHLMWSQGDSNPQPPACKAGALPIAPWPRVTRPGPVSGERCSLEGVGDLCPEVALGVVLRVLAPHEVPGAGGEEQEQEQELLHGVPPRVGWQWA